MSIKWENHWYRSSLSWLTFILLPLSWLFRIAVSIRYFFYKIRIKKTKHFPVPVIVVGNITVGGTGKTPFVVWLADYLKKQGFKPGIVSRGVGGKKINSPCWIDANADAAIVGDEAVLLARRTRCPMVVGIDRVAVINELLKKSNCDIVISDDGLQRYSMGRSMEIAIVDGMRGFGNQQLLPAGPLREPVSRLKRADMVVVNCGNDSFSLCNKTLQEKTGMMRLQGEVVVSLQNTEVVQSLEKFKHKKVHAVAGIGNPARFFALLKQYQIQIIEHVFKDHYLYQSDDLEFSDDLPIIMTEKDAVKCLSFANEKLWYLPVEAEMSTEIENKLEALCVN